jgi:hypothetical protein
VSAAIARYGHRVKAACGPLMPKFNCMDQFQRQVIRGRGISAAQGSLSILGCQPNSVSGSNVQALDFLRVSLSAKMMA